MSTQSALLVLVAQSGRTYELEAASSTKVSKVQTALENLTGVPPKLQILTIEGTALDADKTFGHYDLSEGKFSEGIRVFFYNKSNLQPSSLPPKPEVLPALKIETPKASRYQPHKHPLQRAVFQVDKARAST